MGANLDDRKACLFSSRGELLWQSPAWFPDRQITPEGFRMMGYGWHEMVVLEDYERLMAWFANGKEGPIQFRCMLANTGGFAMFTQYKIPYGEHWLTIGDAVEINYVTSAPPCAIYDNDEKTG